MYIICTYAYGTNKYTQFGEKLINPNTLIRAILYMYMCVCLCIFCRLMDKAGAACDDAFQRSLYSTLCVCDAVSRLEYQTKDLIIFGFNCRLMKMYSR